MSEDTSRTVPPTLWEPAAWEESRLGRFALRLEHDYGVDLGRDYEALRTWSLEHLDTFWLEVWRELRLPASPEPTVALADERLPGAVWFPEVTTNYAEAMLALPGRAEDDVVVVSRSQSREERTWTAAELRLDVARVRAGLVSLGVERGDRAVAVVGQRTPHPLPAQVAARPVALPRLGGGHELLVGHRSPRRRAGAAVVGDAGVGGQSRAGEHDQRPGREQVERRLLGGEQAHAPYLTRARARAFSASTSRFFGGAVVTRSSSRWSVMCAISLTAA